MRKSVVSIAATDGSGHAGLFNDLRVFDDLDLHATGVVTGLTYQNSQSMSGSQATGVDSLQAQWEMLAKDLDIAALKVGLLFDPQQLNWLLRVLKERAYAVVIDPILSSSVGGAFSDHHAEALRAGYLALLPHCSVITPNIPEAQWLLQCDIRSVEEVESAARQLHEMGAEAVLIKGGHLNQSLDGGADACAQQPPRCQDYFHSKEARFWLSQARQQSETDRGTGCMLSSAIAAFHAQGKRWHDAAVLANAYVNRGMREGYKAGQGNGVLANTGWPDQYGSFPTVSDHAAALPEASFASCETDALGLYPVVDSVDWVEKLLKQGVKTIQIRVKDKPPEELDKIVSQCAELGRQYDARMFINDYWQLAIKHQAYGVHLGQEDMLDAHLETIREAGLRLGLSTHSEYEWARATAVKPSYVAFGAVFPTQTKPAQVIGVEQLGYWLNIVQPHFPVCAIGGISADRFDEVLAQGARSLAVVTAITKADDYAQATQALMQRISDALER